MARRCVREEVAVVLWDGGDVLLGVLGSNGLDDDCLGADAMGVGVVVKCRRGLVHDVGKRAVAVRGGEW